MSTTAREGQNYTKEQKKTIRNYKVVIAVEVVAVLFLIAARWIWGGWWINWNTSDTVLTGETTESSETKVGEFVAPEFDPAAVEGTPDVDESLGWSALTIDEGYVVHVCGVLNANEDRTLPIWFSSDADNTIWTKLRILDTDGNMIGETGLIRPGEYVELVQLTDAAVSGNVTLQVMGYEPDSYYSAGSVGLATTLHMPE